MPRHEGKKGLKNTIRRGFNLDFFNKQNVINQIFLENNI